MMEILKTMCSAGTTRRNRREPRTLVGEVISKVAEVGSMADAEYILAPGVYVCGGKKYVIK